MLRRLITVAVKSELDVVACRQRARQVAALCNFPNQDQVRIATAVSELARNIFDYAHAGKVEFAIAENTTPQSLVIRIEDRGPGIDNLDVILAGQYQSKTGSGLGILGARRLMDQCDISTTKGAGTRIVLAKTMSRDSPVITPTKIGTFGKQLAALPDNVVLAEVQLQNRDLIDALEALQSRQVELLELTETLEKSSRDIAVLNAQLDEKALHLESADRHKDEFLAILGHELRGPLSAAGMAGSMLQMPSVPEARVRHLGEVITRQVGHMNRLVEDLLDVSRVSRGLLALDQACVDMTTVVLDAVEQIGPFIKTKAHELSIALPDEPCWVFGDRARLIQVVTNLLSNAVRYTPEGGRITLSLVTDQNSTSITVRDSGIGINTELLPYLFDLYVQAERSSDRKNGGLGLGLALVKSLVEAHGGTVTVKSDGKDLGSSFTVRLRRIITSASEATA